MHILSLPGRTLGLILCKICVYNTNPEDYKPENSVLCESIKLQTQTFAWVYQQMKLKFMSNFGFNFFNL